MRKFLAIIFIFGCFVAGGGFAADKVNINTASLQQLDVLTGIGPVLAQRIIDARPFSSVDDLLRVSGIGPKTLQDIKDQGLACANCPPAPAISNPQPAALAKAPETERKQNPAATNKMPASLAAAGLPNEKNSVKNDSVAALNQSAGANQDNKTKNPWFLFFTAVAAAVILAAIVLIIKLKISKKTI